jgi:hypothetical protein
MRSAFQLSLLTYAFAAWPVLGGELRPTLDVNEMRVIVSYVSVGELVNLQASTVTPRSTGAIFAKITVRAA